MFTPSQSRAARALINWSQPQLAEASGTGVSTIRDFETGKRSPIANNLAAIRGALETAGCIFIDENGEGPGVRLKKTPQTAAEVSDRIQALEAKAAAIPEPTEPSPEAALNTMKKAVVENEIVKLRNRKRQIKKDGQN